MRRFCFASLVFAACGTLVATTAIGADTSSDNPQRSPLDTAVDTAARTFFADACRVGLSLAVVDGNDTAPHFYNYGSVSRSREQLATPTTIYEIASVTKTFTGALAAKAVVDERLRLDADFRDALPEPYANLQYKGHPITLRTLASHTAGMPRDIPDTDVIMKDADVAKRPERLLAVEQGFKPTDFPVALRKTVLRSAPGATEEYSNAGMKVIALGLEHVYETPFDIQLSRVILEPLRMSDTTLALAPTQMVRLATGYGKDGKATPYHTVNAGPSWGLYSDTADMARYVRWQLDEKDPVIAQAHALIAGTPADGKGLIWNEGLDRGERMLWHGGGSFGMSSQVVLYPARQRGVVLLANDACPGTEGVLKAMGMALGAIKP